RTFNTTDSCHQIGVANTRNSTTRTTNASNICYSCTCHASGSSDSFCGADITNDRNPPSCARTGNGISYTTGEHLDTPTCHARYSSSACYSNAWTSTLHTSGNSRGDSSFYQFNPATSISHTYINTCQLYGWY